MLTFPKYQPIFFNKPQICGNCEILTFPNQELYYQLEKDEIDTAELFDDTEFEINPFSEITSNDLVFEVDLPNATDLYFQLYLGTQTIVFLKRDGFYEEQIAPNVWLKNIGTTQMGVSGRIHTFLVANIDAIIGTTSTDNLGVITIANVPANSYVYDFGNLLINVTTIVAPTIATYMQNGYYDNITKKMKFGFISNFITQALIYNKQIPLALEAGKTYKLNFDYTTLKSNIIVAFGITDILNQYIAGGTTTSLVQDLNGNLSLIFTVPTNDIYKVNIEFTATQANPDFTQVFFDNISVKELLFCEITEIKLIKDNLIIDIFDNNGNTNVINIDNQSHVIVAVNISEILTSVFEDADIYPYDFCFNLKMKDCNDVVYNSNKFKILDPNKDPCFNKKTRISWYNNCDFAGLKYPVGVLNDVYVDGFIRRVSGEKLTRSIFVNSNGKHTLNYNLSYDKYLLKVINYTDNIHTFIERAFLHSHFFINNERYMIENGSNYDLGRANSGRTTSEIELVKEGTELVILSCCDL